MSRMRYFRSLTRGQGHASLITALVGTSAYLVVTPATHCRLLQPTPTVVRFCGTPRSADQDSVPPPFSVHIRRGDPQPRRGVRPDLKNDASQIPAAAGESRSGLPSRPPESDALFPPSSSHHFSGQASRLGA